MTYPLRTIQEDGGAVVILDQTRLPREIAFVVLRGLADAAHAIRSMQVRGAPLIVIEAMKMEHTIVAPADGIVASVNFGVGDRVAEGADLVDLEDA